MNSDLMFKGLNSAVAIVNRDNWGSKQNNDLDQKTKFIYYCVDYEQLEAKISLHKLDSRAANYARRRWVNFKRHDAWLEIILEVFESDAEKNPDDFHKTEDLTISHLGVKYPFDLKVTVWSSRASDLDIGEYGYWLYKNQSTEQRYHNRPRLFVVARSEKDIYDHARACRTIEELRNNFDQHLQSYVLDNATVKAVAIEIC